MSGFFSWSVRCSLRGDMHRTPRVPHVVTTTLALLVASSVGCNDHPVRPVELDSRTEETEPVALEINRNVDVLFVVDNSGSMGEEQAKLAANFSRFVERLEELDANYRIAVTTTDNGNVACSGSTPEAGSLRAISCRDRAGEFTFTGTSPATQAFDVACAANCPAELGAGLETLPTTTAKDPNPRARPWIERTDGRTNLPEGVSAGQAFQCFGPQGIDGCGFEAPLESMYKAVARSATPGDASYDFLRDDAILAVVFVTDEADCSANEMLQPMVFGSDLTEAEKQPFWEDPTGNSPRSAICWNAGTKCSGGPGLYEDCVSADYDVTGAELNVDAAPTDAVLRPVDRYAELLQGIQDQKRAGTQGTKVLVAVIGGVPGNYQTGSVPLIYQDESDPAERINFGIGKGCTSASVDGEVQTAIPPVRLKELAGEFNTLEDGRENLYSICDEDYTPALDGIADELIKLLGPACLDGCARDVDPAAGLQPECFLTQTDGVTGARSDVPACEGNETLPADASVCYQVFTDDTIDPECTAAGSNIEFKVIRAPEAPAPAGTVVEATCSLAKQPEIECAP